MRIEKRSAEEKYIVAGPVRIRYETRAEGDSKRICVGPLSLKYRFIEHDKGMDVRILGINIPWHRRGKSRRELHYEHRRELDDEACKRLLTRELAEGLGYTPNIDAPRSLNEKILWMKFHYRDPLITTCCDKHAVKDYVAERVGEQYILPTLCAWERAEDIDFDVLPDSFALKVNWSSGFNIIVRDKSKMDRKAVRERVAAWMQEGRNSYYDTFNWGYKDMKPVVYAEPYIEQIDGQVYDYKLFINQGRFVFMFISTNRYTKGSKLTYTYFDSDLRRLPLTYGGKPNADPVPAMPQHIEEMIQIAKRLAEPFPFVRVDFYEPDPQRFLVGEMTFYCGGGTLGFDPVEWDYKLGELVTLPGCEES